MSWGILALLLLGSAVLKKMDERHFKRAGYSATLCRPRCDRRILPGSYDCAEEGTRDYCTGEVKRGKKWVPSTELIEGSWCATETKRHEDRCLPTDAKAAALSSKSAIGPEEESGED